MVKRLLKWVPIVFGGLVLLVVAAISAAIAFGGPSRPPPMTAVRDAVVRRDRSDAPAVKPFTARDGIVLAYRDYPAPRSVGAAVLIHGSVGSGIDMHEVVKALAAAGIRSYAPDLRGHGASGRRGDVDYIGQLDDDLSDLLDALDKPGPERRVLIGHSAGGGFALRIAALRMSTRFAGTILLAPYLSFDAPTNTPHGADWARVGIPRFIGETILDRFGVTFLEGLPVISFAVDPAAAPHLAADYSYRLLINFAPHRDWRRDIASTRGPLVVLVGARDELFRAGAFAETFRPAAKGRVQVLPGVDHMGMTADPTALTAIVAAAQGLLASP